MGKNTDGKNSNDETKLIYLYHITTKKGAMSHLYVSFQIMCMLFFFLFKYLFMLELAALETQDR